MASLSSNLVKYSRNPDLRANFIKFLIPVVAEHRYELFQTVLNSRTRYVTVVLEDLFQAQNASAVLRSCECFGVQDVHIIENTNRFEVNPEVDMSASKWLTLHKHCALPNNTASAINALKLMGYRVVATTPHEGAHYIHEFDVTKGEFALLFGTELTGLSEEALNMADEFVKLPMYGFVQSYNISVSVALCLYELLNRVKATVPHWGLADDERADILLRWLLLSVKGWEMLERRFLAETK